MSDDLIKAQLRVLAGYGLCSNYHKDQASKIADDWLNKRNLYFPQLLLPVTAQTFPPLVLSAQVSSARPRVSTVQSTSTVVPQLYSRPQASQYAPVRSTLASRVPSPTLETSIKRSSTMQVPSVALRAIEQEAAPPAAPPATAHRQPILPRRLHPAPSQGFSTFYAADAPRSHLTRLHAPQAVGTAARSSPHATTPQDSRSAARETYTDLKSDSFASACCQHSRSSTTPTTVEQRRARHYPRSLFPMVGCQCCDAVHGEAILQGHATGRACA